MVSRILVHTPEPTSSAGRYVYECAKAMSEAGQQSWILCPSNHDFLKEMDEDPRIHPCPSRARSTKKGRSKAERIADNLRFVFSSAWGVFKNARRGDIVHFQYAIHFPLEALFFFLARSKGSRIVFTAHDPLPHKWSLTPRFRWLEFGALRWLYKCSDKILVHSNAGKNTIIRNFPESAEKVEVIVHGPYQMKQELAPLQSDRLELLFFGALRENKGPHLAIEATQKLYALGLPVHLTIAGSVLNAKEQAYWTEAKKLIASCPEPITLQEEFIPEEQVPEIFSRSHCLILPYGKFFSDSGVAFLALANGRPIMTTAAGGLGELLEASHGGILIHEASVAAVMEAIQEALAIGFVQLAQRGKQGSEWVLETCSWKNVAKQTLDVYSKLS